MHSASRFVICIPSYVNYISLLDLRLLIQSWSLDRVSLASLCMVLQVWFGLRTLANQISNFSDPSTGLVIDTTFNPNNKRRTTIVGLFSSPMDYVIAWRDSRDFLACCRSLCHVLHLAHYFSGGASYLLVSPVLKTCWCLIVQIGAKNPDLVSRGRSIFYCSIDAHM